MLRSWRRVAQVTAIVLLAWTAVDLTVPECCLAETLLAGSSGTTVNVPDEGGTRNAPVDDCFCCAMCIDTGIRSPLLRIEAARTAYAEPLRQLATRVVRLDHPPQNA